MNGRHIRTTIVYGLLFGLMFLPVRSLLAPFLGGAMAFRIILWMGWAGYVLLLARWGRVGVTTILIPLGLPLIPVALGGAPSIFFLILLGVLSWIRSGIAFPGGMFRKGGAEAVLCMGGALLVGWHLPLTPLRWALGIWLFFLVQSLYFLFLNAEFEKSHSTGEDPFERARRRAEEILVSR